MTPSILKYYLALLEAIGYHLYYDSDFTRWEAYASDEMPVFWDKNKEELIQLVIHEVYEKR